MIVNKITVRLMKKDDLDAVSLIYHAVFPEDEVSNQSQMLELFNMDKSNINLVAEDTVTNEIVGYVMGAVHHIYFELIPFVTVWGFCVKPELRSNGIGKLLMSKLEKNAQEIGCNSIWLFTNLKNTKAHAFYENSGFIHKEKGYIKVIYA